MEPRDRRHLSVRPVSTVGADALWDARTPASPDTLTGDTVDADVVVVGTGAGGSSAAWALRDSGARVLVVEMGDYLPKEQENWVAEDVYLRRRYKSDETWVD